MAEQLKVSVSPFDAESVDNLPCNVRAVRTWKCLEEEEIAEIQIFPSYCIRENHLTSGGSCYETSKETGRARLNEPVNKDRWPIEKVD